MNSKIFYPLLTDFLHNSLNSPSKQPTEKVEPELYPPHQNYKTFQRQRHQGEKAFSIKQLTDDTKSTHLPIYFMPIHLNLSLGKEGAF